MAGPSGARRPATSWTTPAGAGRPTWLGSTCTPRWSPPRCWRSWPTSAPPSGTDPTACSARTPTTGAGGSCTRCSATPSAARPPTAPSSVPLRSASAPYTSLAVPISDRWPTCGASRRPGPTWGCGWSPTGESWPGRHRSPGPKRSARPGWPADLCVDGAIGSGTAALHADYTDRPGRGVAYLDVDQIAEHLIACTRAGVQGGFHCIGDAAVSAAVDGLRRAAAALGTDRVRAARHRLEHVEMIAASDLSTLADLAVTASVQPAFDAEWGGPGELYEQRLGPRAATMNPFGSLLRAGRAAGPRHRRSGDPGRGLAHRPGRRRPLAGRRTPHRGAGVHRGHPGRSPRRPSRRRWARSRRG